MAKSDGVLIVGGGIFGATAALTLARRGRKVALVDPGQLPHPRASSTDISKVIRMDYGADEFYMATMERALRGWRAWNREWPEPLYHETGFLLLTREELSDGSFEGDSFALLEARGHQPERLDEAAIAARFPAWSEAGYVDGYFNAQAGWAQAGEVVARILESCRQEGVLLREGVHVEQLWTEGTRVRGVETSEGRIGAEQVVLAAGAWTPGLLPELEGNVWSVGQPVFHFKTDRLDVFQPPKFVIWAADISETGWYGFPALDDGTVKIANHGPGKRIAPERQEAVDPEHESRFRSFLRDSLPALADAPILDSRLCFYSDSWDGDFYIDEVPGYEG
ncbi:MAG: FAD-dependent oxidoreductase, partial [Anaerolineales bacterium]|nr:FAD-dependent oxidoreductase [Anaerolineales bacterium]